MACCLSPVAGPLLDLPNVLFGVQLARVGTAQPSFRHKHAWDASTVWKALVPTAFVSFMVCPAGVWVPEDKK